MNEEERVILFRERENRVFEVGKEELLRKLRRIIAKVDLEVMNPRNRGL